MDFDDFLNELGASSPEPVASTTKLLASSDVHVTSTSFSIEDDEIDNLFSSVTNSAPITNPLANVETKKETSAILKESVVVDSADYSNRDATIDDIFGDLSISSVLSPPDNYGANTKSNVEDFMSPPPNSSKQAGVDIMSSPELLAELSAAVPESVNDQASKNSNDIDLFDSLTTPPPTNNSNLIGVSTSKILETLKVPSDVDASSLDNAVSTSLTEDFNSVKIESNLEIVSPAEEKPTLVSKTIDSKIEETIIKEKETPKQQSENEFMAWLEEGTPKALQSNSTTNSNNNLFSFDARPRSPLDIQSEIKSIIQSSFPDIPKLRELLLENRKVPQSLRCTVWNILLTGSSIEDLEAKYYHYKEDSSDDKNFELMVKDVDILLKQLSKNSDENSERQAALKIDIIDIISLYCLRKNVQYNPLYLQLLLPIAQECSPFYPRTIISSSFYNFIDNFVPLARLDAAYSDSVMNILHFWLHLLVGYHSPKLLQHLDRVVPGWHRPFKGDLSPVEVEQAKTILRNTSNLNKLERDLGLDSIDDPFGWDVTVASALPVSGSSPSAWSRVKGSSSDSLSKSAPVESSRKHLNPSEGEDSEAEEFGFITQNWIAANFSGCLPSSMSLAVYDWAILHEEKFAGIYLIASLLELFCDMLITMNGLQIKAWFDAIAHGQDDWFKLLPASVVRKYFNQNINGDSKSSLSEWSVFVTGWLHVTSALLKKTPLSFVKAVKKTEDWWNELDGKHKAKISTDSNPSKSLFQVADEDDDAFMNQGFSSDLNRQTSNNSAPFLTKSLPGANLMAQFQKLRTQFQIDTSAEALKSTHSKHNDADNQSKQWPQELYTESQTLCLWTDSNEIVSSLTSNRRRVVSNYDCVKYFDQGVSIYNQTNGTGLGSLLDPDPSNNTSFEVCLPRPDDSAAEIPFYFGIDCRTEDEKRLLGTFPRTFAFNPTLLSDSDEVTKLLETLTPLTTSAHLCLIGAGEDFYKWHETYQAAMQQNIQQKKLWGIAALGKQPNATAVDTTIAQHNIAEERSKLNSLALFFMKKSFRHVSVLNGGFTAALRQIHHSQTNNLSSYVIDTDVNVINSLLGYDASHVGTVARLSPPSISSNPANSSDFNQPPPVSQSSSTLSNFQKVSGTVLNNLSSATNQLLFPDPQPITPVNEAPPQPAPNAKELFSGFTKKLSIFGSASLETIKKSVSSVTASQDSRSSGLDNSSVANDSDLKRKEGFVLVGKGTDKSKIDRQSAFVIDDDEEEDREHEEDKANIHAGSASSSVTDKDSHGVSVRRTENERQHALILHKLAGLSKGDTIEISRDFLPGAILFPCHKYKRYPAGAAAAAPSPTNLLDLPKNTDDALDNNEDGSSPDIVHEVHRFLVVTKERFMVIDAGGGGVGATAIVKSNHHLTELIKITFRKKNPELVTLFFLQGAGATKSHQYRVPKKQEFVTALQKNMQQFK